MRSPVHTTTHLMDCVQHLLFCNARVRIESRCFGLDVGACASRNPLPWQGAGLQNSAASAMSILVPLVAPRLPNDRSRNPFPETGSQWWAAHRLSFRWCRGNRSL